VRAVLLEKVTMPRLASPHLPSLHPTAFIFLFSLREQSPLPDLSSPTPYSQARSQARVSKGARGGRWSPAPPTRAGQALGLLAESCSPRHSPALCCAFTRSAARVPSWLVAQRPRDVAGLCPGSAGRGEGALVWGKPFPAAKQQSCTDSRGWTGADI